MGTLVVTSKQTGPISADSIAIYFSIAAYMVAVVPYMVHGHTALGMLCLVLSLWRLHLAYANTPPPSSDTTTIVGVAAIAILAGLTELRLNPQSGVIALMVLIGCKNLAARTPGQFTNNLLLLPFLPMGLFLTVDPSWATGFLVAFLWVWLSALVRVWQRQGTLRKTLAQGLQTLAVLTPLILLSYFLLPRPHAWWNQEQQQAKTGMSSTLKPGDVGKLSQNQETAFFATFPNGVPIQASNMYWRGLTLSVYKDGEWSGTPRWATIPDNWARNDTAVESGIPYQVMFNNKDDNYLYSLEYSRLSKGTMMWDSTALVPERANRQLYSSYDGVYYPKATMNIKPLPSEMAPIQNDNPKATLLAKELWAQAPTADGFLMKLRDHIQKDGFVYSLEPGQMQQSWIDTFLDRKKGFCEHYAGTTVYMLRQVGIPARVVVGFQGAKPFTNANTLDVPYSAAHAWIEYWSAPLDKWVRLDPTAWVAPERLTAQHWEQAGSYTKSTWWNELGFLTVQVESQWKIWVTYYDADQQRELWLKMSHINWTPLVLGLFGMLGLGWLYADKRWYALSPIPLHQWKWSLKNANLPSSTTVVAYKRRIGNEFKYVLPWLNHVEMSLYADVPTKIVDYGVWLKVLVSMKSMTYRHFKKNLHLIHQTP